ncbi:tetratricopeptide repeat protein [Dolichospermum sp. ST_sed1]|nr:tetratricopeptide repeat protein [Dolichospermum sp. ST_sed1]MDD1428716.1 tetratricopeptide repeat protein [Dolichospermum sp. ST_sed9]MDD1443892.1 tetratricopeptide repeat protein [Dolichospermum sp. ST_sed3]MDD1448536.1 tetratricopeptide repeat protein [Dolichospermum sp. ST_sed8]MDD1458232.1 tetratricopeptide repeat protein [Dolichospermum sp. ST_sed7]MDD1461497.1 tetratricopeptide repeat protein [Dolichospermum sp. ST_sed2]MDD1466306.1 tetratricopeptide repeat protein [Dolichospermum s
MVIQQQNMQPVTPISNQSIITNKSSQYYLEEGNKLLNIENYEQAILCYDKAIAIQPDCYQSWHFRGVSLDDLEKYEEAIASYDKAIAIKPDHDDA